MCLDSHLNKDEVGALWNRFKPSSNMFQGGACFVDHLCYFYLEFVMLSHVSVYWCCVATTWERADLWLSFVMSNGVFVFFQCGIMGLVWYLIVSISDLYPLSYFDNKNKFAFIWNHFHIWQSILFVTMNISQLVNDVLMWRSFTFSWNI